MSYKIYEIDKRGFEMVRFNLKIGVFLFFLCSSFLYCFPAKDENTLFLVDFEETGIVYEKVSGKEMKINERKDSEEHGKIKWVDGIKGKGVSLLGTNVISGNIQYSLIPPFTIEIWCKLLNRPLGEGGGYLFAKGQYKNSGIILGINPNLEVIVNFPGATNTVTLKSKQVLSPFKWHHIAFTYDGKKGKIYIDGTLDREKSMPNYKEFKGETKIGYSGGYYYYYQGLIEGVKVSKGIKTNFIQEGNLIKKANKDFKFILPEITLPDVSKIDAKKFKKDLILHIPLDGDVSAVIDKKEEPIEPISTNKFLFDEGIFYEKGVTNTGYGSKKSLQFKLKDVKLTIPGEKGASLSCWVKINDLFKPDLRQRYKKLNYERTNFIFGIKTKDVPGWYTDRLLIYIAGIDENWISIIGQLGGVRVVGDVYNLEVGKWHNIIVTTAKTRENRIKGCLYLDGLKIGTFYDQSLYPSPKEILEFWIGVVGGNDGVLFNYKDGQIDEICLWKRALTEQEVKEYYALTKTGKDNKEKK